MKNTYALLLILLIITTVGSVIYYFYPTTNPTSINEKITAQKKSVGNSKDTQTNISIPSETEQQTKSSNEKQVLDRLFDFIKNAPFDAEDSSSTLGANDEEVQRYVSSFRTFIENKIIQDESLTANQKANILWSFFTDMRWRGEDNAFRAVVVDALLSTDLSLIMDKMVNSYHGLISSGDSSVSDRHDILQLISTTQLNHVDDVQITRLANEAFISQITTSQSVSEVKDLSGYAIQNLMANNKDNDITNENISHVLNSAERSQTLADTYIDSLVVSAVRQPQTSDLIFQNLLTKPLSEINKNALNDSLAFQISDDRNFSINEISANNLTLIKDYVNSQQANNKNEEWNKMLQRVNNAAP